MSNLITNSENYIQSILSEMNRLREDNKRHSILRPAENITDRVAYDTRAFFSVPGYNIIEIRKCMSCANQWSVIIQFD